MRFPTFKIAVLTALILFVSCGNEQRSLLLVTNGGIPGSPSFRVELSEDKTLHVTKEGVPIQPDGHFRKVSVSVNLSRKEANRIFQLAANANDFSEKESGSYTYGTNASMDFHIGKRNIHRDCTNVPNWPVGSETFLLVSEINKHLNEYQRVH